MAGDLEQRNPSLEFLDRLTGFKNDNHRSLSSIDSNRIALVSGRLQGISEGTIKEGQPDILENLVVINH